jgi:hypothetical protein
MKSLDLEKVMLTSKQVCGLYSITKTTLSNWIGKGFPRLGRNQYPLLSGFHWAIENVFSGASDEMKAAKLRRELSRAEISEMDVAQRKGKLVDSSEALILMAAHIGAAKAAFMGLPKRLGSEIITFTDPHEAISLLKREINGILKKLGESKAIFEKEIQRLRLSGGRR